MTPLRAADVAAQGSVAQLWTLLAPFAYISPTLGTITAPEDFQTDLASVPKAVWNILSPEDPCILYGSIIHDYLYSLSGVLPDGRIVTKDQADALLRETILLNGGSHLVAEGVYLAVKEFGGSHWGTNSTSRPT